MENGTTTIEASHDTWRQLHNRKYPGMSFDHVIQHLLDGEEKISIQVVLDGEIVDPDEILEGDGYWDVSDYDELHVMWTSPDADRTHMTFCLGGQKDEQNE